MATIQTFNTTDSGATIRTNLNSNFSALNTEATATANGLVPTPPNDTTKFLRGDATWATGGSAITVITSATSTLSMTTTANQKVVVWAKGSSHPIGEGGANYTVLLKYNGTQKDSINAKGGTAVNVNPFSLMYTETPGAGTANITVTTTETLNSDITIIAMIIG